MRLFFQVTGVLIILIAAGLLSRAVQFLQAAGDLETVDNAVYNLTDVHWLTIDSEAGNFLAGIFGWDPRPSVEQVVVYAAYLVPALVLFFWRGRAGPSPAPQPPGHRHRLSPRRGTAGRGRRGRRRRRPPPRCAPRRAGGRRAARPCRAARPSAAPRRPAPPSPRAPPRPAPRGGWRRRARAGASGHAVAGVEERHAGAAALDAVGGRPVGQAQAAPATPRPRTPSCTSSSTRSTTASTRPAPSTSRATVVAHGRRRSVEDLPDQRDEVEQADDADRADDRVGELPQRPRGTGSACPWRPRARGGPR